LLLVAAELEAHGRHHAVGELRLAARREALADGGGEDRRGYALVDRGLERPAPLTRIGDVTREVAQLGVAREGRCREVEQPRCDDAATPPDLCDVAQVEVVLV